MIDYYLIAVAIVTIIAIMTELFGFVCFLATKKANRTLMNAGTLLLFLSAILCAVAIIIRVVVK